MGEPAVLAAAAAAMAVLLDGHHVCPGDGRHLHHLRLQLLPCARGQPKRGVPTPRRAVSRADAWCAGGQHWWAPHLFHPRTLPREARRSAVHAPRARKGDDDQDDRLPDPLRRRPLLPLPLSQHKRERARVQRLDGPLRRELVRLGRSVRHRRARRRRDRHQPLHRPRAAGARLVQPIRARAPRKDAGQDGRALDHRCGPYPWLSRPADEQDRFRWTHVRVRDPDPLRPYLSLPLLRALGGPLHASPPPHATARDARRPDGGCDPVHLPRGRPHAHGHGCHLLQRHLRRIKGRRRGRLRARLRRRFQL
mmetsp:Transcript_38098/g.123268  ORF Transcript_38098/g.123268 Transcript_38098/m.123268 type:complete len:308 (+) Transcript_38098:2652-3575(+)